MKHKYVHRDRISTEIDKDAKTAKKMFETNSSFEHHDRMIIRLAQNSAIILPYYTIQQKQIQIFKEEDEKMKAKVTSRNMYESYLFTVRAAHKEYKDNLEEEESIELEKLINENFKWLDANREDDASVYDEKLKTIQTILNPYMNRLIKSIAAAEYNESNGPKIEEVN